MNLEILVGPIMGSVIGYFTNYIAVKMLFRPLKAIKIGNFTLPFTPGVIPKRKEALALSLGNAVGNNLLTIEDIENTLVTDTIKSSIIKEVLDSLTSESDSTSSIRDIGKTYIGITYYETGKANLEAVLCHKIKEGINKLDLGKIISEEGIKILKGKTMGTMFSMFINDDLIASIAEPIGKHILDYFDENGEEILQPIIHDELELLEQESIPHLINRSNLSTEHLYQMIETMYTSFIHHHATKLLTQINLSEIVEKKVLEMDVIEIETLVLSVMKTELNTIVNLGALIGFIIGLLTILL